MPDFGEMLCEEAVLHIISVMEHIPAFHRTYVLFSYNAVWASAERIVSDTLISSSYAVKYVLLTSVSANVNRSQSPNDGLNS